MNTNTKIAIASAAVFIVLIGLIINGIHRSYIQGNIIEKECVKTNLVVRYKSHTLSVLDCHLQDEKLRGKQ